MSEPDDTLYARHSRWSDPDRFGAYLAALPPDPEVLPDIIGGLMLHPLCAPATATRSPELRCIADIIDAILAKDGRPLDQSSALTKCSRPAAAKPFSPVLSFVTTISRLGCGLVLRIISRLVSPKTIGSANIEMAIPGTGLMPN
jgi:hypothetical protein